MELRQEFQASGTRMFGLSGSLAFSSSKGYLLGGIVFPWNAQVSSTD